MDTAGVDDERITGHPLLFPFLSFILFVMFIIAMPLLFNNFLVRKYYLAIASKDIFNSLQAVAPIKDYYLLCDPILSYVHTYVDWYGSWRD